MNKIKIKQNIPQRWSLKKLSDVLDYERPDNYIVRSTSYSNKARTPVLTANKSFILGYIDEDFGVYKNTPAIIFDDFTTDSKFVDFPFKVKSSAIKILKEKNQDVDLRFVFEKMKSVNFPTGSHKRFYISQYQNMEIIVPPIDEQQKIAEILGTADEDIVKTQEVIEAAEKLKRGLMQQLFTRGIGRKKSKKTKIGEIPEEWEVLELGKICDVRDGTHSSPKYHEEGIPLITSKNLVDNKLDFKNISLISGTDFQEIERRSRVDDGDILFGMIGTIGNPVIVKKDRDFAIKNVALIKFTESKMNNVFVLYFLKSTHTEGQFNQKKGGSTQKFIALGVIRQILVTVPSPREQKEIAEILSAVDEKISVNKKLKEKLTLLKKGLMQDLLSGRVRVNN